MALCTLATLLLGLQRIVAVIGVVGPVIVALTAFTAIATLVDGASDFSAGVRVAGQLDVLRASENWAFAALLYVGLALPGLAGFLPAVGATTDTKSEANAVAALGPALFVGALVLVVLALLGNVELVHGAEVPILVLATKVFPVYGTVFAAVIFLGIYTTVTPLLWTVCRRFAVEDSRRYRVLAVGLTLIRWVGGNLLPFGQLVNWIYPTVGYVGLLFLGCQIYKDVRRYRGGLDRSSSN